MKPEANIRPLPDCLRTPKNAGQPRPKEFYDWPARARQFYGQPMRAVAIGSPRLIATSTPNVPPKEILAIFFLREWADAVPKRVDPVSAQSALVAGGSPGCSERRRKFESRSLSRAEAVGLRSQSDQKEFEKVPIRS